MALTALDRMLAGICAGPLGRSGPHRPTPGGAVAAAWEPTSSDGQAWTAWYVASERP
jgi:hypothetical protein